MKLSDFCGASDCARESLKQTIDALSGPSLFRIQNCDLPPGTTPAQATVGFYKKGSQYVIHLDRRIRYTGENSMMAALCAYSHYQFRDYDEMWRFFQTLVPSPTSEPPEPPQNNPRGQNTSTREPATLSTLFDIDKIVMPTPKARAALDYRTIQRELEKIIMGQAVAIETISHQAALFLNKSNPKKPLSIVAYGPPGTGKSEAAKALSKVLTKLSGRKYADVWTDLNTFTEAHSVYRLTGAPPGYVGYEDKPVFEAVSNNPYTVFIFDELDKAHPDVLKTLMAILDEGRCAARKELPDGSREYNFRHCIFIFTSNLRLGEATKPKQIGFTPSCEVESIHHTDSAVEVRFVAEQAETEPLTVTQRIYRDTEAARKAFVGAGVLREIASRFHCFVEFRELTTEAKIRILVKMVVETGMEYNIRLAHIAAPILQALVNASTLEDALTVRSFRSVIEGYLATAFAEAGARYGSNSLRLDGTLDAPQLIPI